MSPQAYSPAPRELPWATRLGVTLACLWWPPWLEVRSLERVVAAPRGDTPLPPTPWLSGLASLVDRRLTRAPWPWSRTCLRRALVLQRVLATRGHAVSLVVGVRREQGTLQAHAWVEHDGRPVLEPEPERVPTYTVLGRFPSRA